MCFWGMVSVAIAEGSHPFPFRTRKLSPPAPMVLGRRRPGRVGRCRISYWKAHCFGSGPSSRFGLVLQLRAGSRDARSAGQPADHTSAHLSSASRIAWAPRRRSSERFVPRSAARRSSRSTRSSSSPFLSPAVDGINRAAHATTSLGGHRYRNRDLCPRCTQRVPTTPRQKAVSGDMR